MVHMDAKAGMPHFFPALITVGVVAVILFAARAIAIHVEQRTISATAPEAFSLKNQGLAFQRAAAHASDVLRKGEETFFAPRQPAFNFRL